MGRIFLGDQVNKMNPEFRIFLGLPADDNEIVNGGEFEFPSGSVYLAFLYPKKYSLLPSQPNMFHDDYRQAEPYLAHSQTRGTADATGDYADEYNQEYRSINAYFRTGKTNEDDFHIQLRVTPTPPEIDLEPEPITFNYVEGKSSYQPFINMSTQYTSGEVVTVEDSEGEDSVSVPLHFTADEGYILNVINIEVDGNNVVHKIDDEQVTSKTLYAPNVKPDSTIIVWGYGLEIFTGAYSYSQDLVNATSSMEGEFEIEQGEQSITFYANEGFTFDSVGTYSISASTYEFYASGNEYTLTIPNVNGNIHIELVAIPYTDSISPFVNLYEVTRQELGELSLERFSTETLDLQTGQTSSGVDYGDMIVNLIKIPYDIPEYVGRVRQPIKLGKHETNVTSNLLSTNHIEINLGTAFIEGTNKNVADYKNVRAYLYIPYADRMELPIQYVMDNEIKVTLEIDLFSGDSVVIVTSQNVPVFKQMLPMSEKIPFVQLNDSQYSNKINALLYGAVQPFISLESQEVIEQVALPTQQDKMLNELTGYVEVDRILSIDTQASEIEQTEINSLLRNGVMIK